MDEEDAAQRPTSPPDAPGGFRWSEHRAAQMGLIVTIAPIGIAALRLYVVSGGDDVILKSLAATLSIQAMILGTYLVMLPVIVVAASWMAADWVVGSDANLSPAIKIFAMLSLLTASALLIPPPFLVLYLLSVMFFLFRVRRSSFEGSRHWAVLRRNSCEAHRDPRRPRAVREIGPVATVTPYILMWVLALIFIFGTGMWLPAQAVLLRGQSYPSTAYVLNQSDGQTTLLFKDPATVRTVPTAEIEARPTCLAANVPPRWLITPTYVFMLPTTLSLQEQRECVEIIKNWPSNPAAPLKD